MSRVRTPAASPRTSRRISRPTTEARTIPSSRIAAGGTVESPVVVGAAGGAPPRGGGGGGGGVGGCWGVLRSWGVGGWGVGGGRPPPALPALPRRRWRAHKVGPTLAP